MKKITIYILILTCIISHAQNSVTADASSTWTGYMNVFDTAGGYQFGDAWAVADLQTIVDATAGTITLQPNFNAYNATDAYWSDGNGNGNKLMEATTKAEPGATYNEADLTFSGYVVSNTLDAGYTAKYFIKALDPDSGYANVITQTYDLPESGPFTVTATAAELADGLIIQYGFEIYGLNANPDNESALGSVVISSEAPPTPSNSVTADASSTWTGYMTVFDTGGAYQFGEAWGVADLQTILDETAGTITLEPNINTYNATDSYWSDGNGNGNKLMEATTKVEPGNTFNEADLTFSGYVVSNTLDAGYTAKYFIKALDPDAGYANVITQTYDLPESGPFTVTATAAELAAGLVIQYGFEIYGLNANPDNESALGSVVIAADASASVNDNVFNTVKMFPNPAKDYVRFSTNSNENLNIQIFDMLGKSVLRVDSVRNAVNVSELNSGLYFVQMTLGTQKSTKKLVIK